MTTDKPEDRAAMTEEQIQAVSLVPVAPHAGRIHLEDYNPEWPLLFEREASRIRVALGDKVVQLEHVGSTSVPGLAAKPLIDILLIVADSADEQSYVPALEAAGYKLTIREPDWHEHRVFKGRTRTSICTPSRPDRQKPGACSPFAIGYAATPPTASAMNRQSAS